MTIEVTDEMVTAFEQAGTGGYGEITGTHDGLAAVLAIVERDYVTRLGQVVIPVPREMPVTPEIWNCIKGMATERAELMGGRVIDIENPRRELGVSFTDQTVYIWKVRRD